MNGIRVPTTVRQWPRFVQQIATRQTLLKRQLERRRVFRLCYFSCRSYFRYLYCALHSLAFAAKDIQYEVLVFSDTDQPLSPAQVEALQHLVPGLQVIEWPKSMGWGAEQIGWIWKAYQRAAQGAADDDIIARVDSDVYFFNDRIFRAVERSEADFVGDGHFVDFAYCQGGCYFFRVDAVRKINSFLAPISLVDELARAKINVEDIAAHHFASRLGMKVQMTWFMTFPDEWRNARGLTSWQRWKFSCLHFVMKNKTVMIESYLRDMLAPHDRAGLLQQLEIP
jgi:hypothetical protein